MSSIFRVSFCFIALSLSLISPVPGRSQSPASTPPQSSDEETLRRLTEQYAQAIAVSDLERLRQFWNPQSPHLAARLGGYKSFFSTSRREFVTLKVTRLDVAGEKAVSHLTTDERYLDKKSGVIITDRDAYHGVCRAFEWIKRNGEWKIEREFSVQDDLAARLDQAASEQERDGLLEKERVFVTDTLVGALAARGDRHRISGDLDAALRCYQLQRAVAEKIGDQAGVANYWVNVGDMKSMQGDLEQALTFMQKGLALFESARFQRSLAPALKNLSEIYLELGDDRQAFECAQKSIRLSKEMNNPRMTADALLALANVYENQNNYPQALACAESSQAIAQELGDKYRIAVARHIMAFLHKALGNYEQALKLHQELLQQVEGYGDKGGAAMIRAQIGHVFLAQGRYPEALAYYHQALPAFEGDVDKRPTVVVLTGMNNAYLAQEKYAEALPLAERALSLSRQLGRQMYIWHALTDVGYCQLGLNRSAEARQSFSEAISIIEKLRMQTAGGIEDRQRYFEQKLDAHHGMISVLVKGQQAREALEFAERAKARALLDVLQGGRVSVQKAMTAEEQEKERQLKSELTRLNTHLTRATQSDEPDAGQINAFKSQLEKTRLNYEAFQTALYSAHPDLKVQRGEAPVINAQEFGTLLPDAATALLEYVVTDDKIYMFAITRAAAKADTEVRVYTLPVKRDDLASQVEAFRRQLASRDLGFRAAALKLYDLLLKPAQSQLRGKTNLIIAPDDKLWELPFQALLVGANRFLIEEAAIAYAPSLTVLREMTRRPRHRNGDAASASLLALGNPLVGKETANRATLALRDEKLDPLPEAEQEVKVLKRLYGIARSKVYTGAEASEDRVKSEASQATILHFATHGMLNNAAPMYSHLALAEGGAGEDGLLEAWELMQLDLKAELAVLSACETARGRIGAGEGMIGLSWAMFVAGVPATVVSQWKVESAGTRDLMVSFHRALISLPEAGRAKATKTEALRQAALKLMKNAETSHPFYWAGFVLVGDGR